MDVVSNMDGFVGKYEGRIEVFKAMENILKNHKEQSKSVVKAFEKYCDVKFENFGELVHLYIELKSPMPKRLEEKIISSAEKSNELTA